MRDVQHHLAEVLDWVARGEEVTVTRRGKIVARIVPALPVSAHTPDFLARARTIWGPKPTGPMPSDLVDRDREDR